MKFKKGIESYGVVIGIVLVLVAGAIILSSTKLFADEVNEALPVAACRTFNTIHFGIRESTANLGSSPQVCYTIDKSIGDNRVPTKDYSPYDTPAASKEIRDMVKNCWYMWLEGRYSNMFNQYPTSQGCFTCYTFKTKEAVRPTVATVNQALLDPYQAKDISNRCSSSGGYWRSQCLSGETDIPTRNVPPSQQTINSQTLQVQDNKCCIKLNNECENRGGVCASSNPGGSSFYPNWRCSDPNLNCYVRTENFISYAKYVQESTARGGQIRFLTPPGSSTLEFAQNEKYAISFVSPNRVDCYSDPTVGGLSACWASIGNDWHIALGVGGAAVVVGGTVGWVVGTAAAGVSSVFSAVIGLIKPAAVIGGLGVADSYSGGVLYRFADNYLLRPLATFVARPFTIEVPNFIFVSTATQAQQMGCTIQYAS